MSDARSPPTPDGVPLLGNGLAFSRAPFDALEEWATLADVVRLSFPGRDLYVVTEPSLVEAVLVERQDAFTIGRAQRETFAGVEDDAVTATEGERWRRLRRALHPAFTAEGIRAYGDRMAARTADHVDEWTDGEDLDLLSEHRQLALSVLADTLLGTSLDADDAATVQGAADALVARSDPRRPGQLLPGWVPTPTERRFERAVADLDDLVERVLSGAEPGTEDVRGVLLAAHERGDLSDAEVRDNLTALLLAGHDSSAVALTYAWLELSRHEAVRDALVTEVNDVVGDGLPAPEHVDDLSRTRDVVRETLRRYPPAWSVTREAREAVTLGGYDLPAGAQLMLPQWVLHRDERYWDDPATFEPARWRRDVDRPEYAYFPFSGGPRHCVGVRFARLELVLALATMVDRVALDVTTEGPLTFAPALSLRPEVSVRAVVRRR
ncbi:MAG: cytochrome P450 [Halobacteriaceae archaeon]